MTSFLTESEFHATTYSQNPRIIGWFRLGLKGTFKDHLSPRDTFHYTRWLLRAFSKLILNVSRNRASATSADNLFQCFAQSTELGGVVLSLTVSIKINYYKLQLLKMSSTDTFKFWPSGYKQDHSPNCTFRDQPHFLLYLQTQTCSDLLSQLSRECTAGLQLK